jgi:hypothetical protein
MTATVAQASAEPPAAMRPGLTSRLGLPRNRLLLAVALLVGVASVGFRLYSPSQLWLDEAISVSIARCSLPHLVQALRHDGAPPLYYVLLHFWVAAFGSSATAVRSMSTVFSIMTLPAMWWLGRRLGGRRLGVISVALLASSPFATFFGTEARMYALVMLLTVLGAIALARMLERPSWRRGIAVAADSGALLLTHYWSIFLLTTVGGWLLWRAWRLREPRRHLLAAAALAGGVILLAPWLPVMVFQLRHTGTPWATPPRLLTSLQALAQWSASAQSISFASATGGLPVVARLLELSLAALILLGVFGRPLDTTHLVEIDVRGRVPGRALAGICFGAITLGIIASIVLHSGFEPRYTAAMFVLMPPLGALGVQSLPQRWRPSVLAVVVLLGMVASASTITNHAKTQAGEVARMIDANASGGDVVVYCPDQLGPAVHRLVPPSLRQLPFPSGRDPSRVDWVDYASRNRRASPAAFADAVLGVAGPHTIWLVSTPYEYRTFGGKCAALERDLKQQRRAQVMVHANHGFYEHESLLRFVVTSR